MQVKDSYIDSRESLVAAIERLEAEQKEHIRAIKTDMHDAYESLKPVHVIKTLVKELFTSPEVKQDLFQAGIGLGAGFLAKKLVVGNSHNLFKRLMGHLVQVSVTNMVNSNEEVIESKGRSLIQRLIKRYRTPDDTNTDNDEEKKVVPEQTNETGPAEKTPPPEKPFDTVNTEREF
jgi:hypothetical protein